MLEADVNEINYNLYCLPSHSKVLENNKKITCNDRFIVCIFFPMYCKELYLKKIFVSN